MMKKIIGSILCLSLIVSLLCQTSLAADDTVKLTGDKTVDATIVIETNTVYDLNGYTLALAAGTSGSVFYIKGGATLKVMDSSAAKTGKITGGKALAGSSFEASELGFNRGEYRDFTDGCGGGAYVESGAKLVMTGGSITANRAEQGGGVYLESGAELHVSGAASVTGNYYGASGTTPDNVFLPLNGSNQQSAIAVDATLTATARIGITPAARGSAGENAALTSGLRGKGVKENFTADEAGKSVSTNTAGEIIFTSSQQGGQLDDNTTGGLSGNSGDNTSAAGTGSGSSSGSGSSTTTTTTNPDGTTTNGTATVTTTKNADGSTTAKTTETATTTSGDGSKTEVKAESSTTTKSNTDGSTTATTTATQTATTTAADGSKTVTETKTEAKETLDKSGNGTVEAKTTETVKDASGKVTATTVTESKGTVETATDGTKTTTTTNTAVTTAADGTKTTVVTTEKAVETTDGSTGKVVSNESGKIVAVEAKVSETAAESAAKSGETVTLPVTVTAAQSAADATAVAITVPKAAESVKVEIPVEDVKPGTVAIIVHEDGTEEIVKTSTTSKDGVVLALESGASVKVVDNTRTFNDVDGSEWYAGNVAWASSREVMNGVGDSRFAPNEVTTTGMVAQILMNLAGGSADPNSAAEKYSDVKAGDWFAAPISWLTEAGIAQGKGDEFGATEAITRERDIVLLHNYARHMGYDTSARADLNRFADAGSVSDWARDAMAWAVGAGIINGTTDASGGVVLDPQGSATRAQISAITERFCEKTAR